MAESPTIAVTTPTGNVGNHVVRALLRAGVEPVVLLRDASRLDDEVSAKVEARELDQTDRDAVVEATKDVDALFWVDPPSEGEDPVADYVEAGEAVAAAVERNGISRVVFQSSVGAEKREGAGEIDGLGKTEDLLDATDVSVTHLRCGFFFSNLILQLDAIKSGTIPISLPPDAPMGWVAPRDIAEVAAARLLDSSWSGRHVQAVHGPEDLSWEGAAAIVGEVTGRELRVEQIPDDEMRKLLVEGAGMTEGLADAVLGMSTGLRDDFVPEQERDVTTTTPTTLRAWAYDELRPLLA